jgi:predicted nucleic acid-binding protein
LKTSSASASVVPSRIVVDANPIISALISDQSAASRIMWCGAIEELATTAHTIAEVRKYLPELARKAGRSEELLQLDLQLLPLVIYEREIYREKLKEAHAQIGERDPSDVELLALALRLQSPIWSNDRDFENVGIPRYTTTELLKALSAE